MGGALQLSVSAFQPAAAVPQPPHTAGSPHRQVHTHTHTHHRIPKKMMELYSNESGLTHQAFVFVTGGVLIQM